MEIQQVIDTIRKLTAMTTSRGCTESEALVAAQKIGQLLKVYNLSMDKVFLGESKCVTAEIETQGKSRRPIDGCLMAIAAFCDCKVWFQKNYKAISKYCFFGLETDTEMAKYLYELIFNAMEIETQKFKRSVVYVNTTTHRKRLTISFQRGMACRISSRLNEMTQQRHTEENQEIPSTGTSLVLVKQNKVQDEFDALTLRLRKSSHALRPIHLTAFDSGTLAGNKINLNRPVEKTSGLLLS